MKTEQVDVQSIKKKGTVWQFISGSTVKISCFLTLELHFFFFFWRPGPSPATHPSTRPLTSPHKNDKGHWIEAINYLLTLKSVMINHSTKSPLRETQRRVSWCQTASLCSFAPLACRWFTAHPSRAAFKLGCHPLNQKTVWRCQADKKKESERKRKQEREIQSLLHLFLYMKSCNMDMFCCCWWWWWRWWRRRSCFFQFAIMAIRSVTHSINQTDCRFVYPPGWGEVWNSSICPHQLFTSPFCLSAASANLSFPTFLSFFFFFFNSAFLHCPLHKEFFWANFTSVLNCCKKKKKLTSLTTFSLCLLSLPTESQCSAR